MKLPTLLKRLVQRKEMWTLTLHGWLIVLLCLVSGVGGLITQIHPFLAVNAPVQAEALVVEGWIPDYALEAAANEFKQGNYRTLITTGIPLGHGSFLSQYKTFADLSAATLVALGVDSQRIIAVPAPRVKRNRTDAAALALSHWLETSSLKLHSINVYTLGIHARRSQLTYQKALPSIKVGVISTESLDYDPKAWWKYSEGIKLVISETLSYIYIRLFL